MWYLTTKSHKLACLTAQYQLWHDGGSYYEYSINPFSKRVYFRHFMSSSELKLYKTQAAARGQATKIISKYTSCLLDLTEFTIDIVEVGQL